MVKYQVLPNGDQWRVQTEDGSVVSNHRKKDPAVESAKDEAGDDDAGEVHREDGTVQDRFDY